jgi:hydrogenase maturation factor
VTPPTAQVQVGGTVVEAALLTSPHEIEQGDWVLVHSGLVLERLTEHEARDALALRTGNEDSR